MDKDLKETKKLKIAILSIILIVGIFTLSGCTQNEQEHATNNVTNTTNSTSNVSIRNQIFGAQANLIQSVQTQGTTEVKLEDLEAYTKESDSNYKTCTAQNGASFIYPSNWVAVSQEGEQAFMAPDTRGASVNIATDNMEMVSNLVTDFDGYIALQKLYLTQQMTMLSDVNEKLVNLNGRKAYILNYETESAASGTNIQLNVTQVAFEDNGEVNILTLAVIRDYYNELKPTFDKIIKSFMK